MELLYNPHYCPPHRDLWHHFLLHRPYLYRLHHLFRLGCYPLRSSGWPPYWKFACQFPHKFKLLLPFFFHVLFSHLRYLSEFPSLGWIQLIQIVFNIKCFRYFITLAIIIFIQAIGRPCIEQFTTDILHPHIFVWIFKSKMIRTSRHLC